MGGLYVCVWVLLATFAYFVVPDNSPHANLQTAEISKLPPGSSITFLLKPVAQSEKVSLWRQFLYGKPAAFNYIPISRLPAIVQDSLVSYQTLKGIAINSPLGEWQGRLQTDSDLQEKFVVKKSFIMGTDAFGRDVWSRLVVGARVSLAIGFLSMLLSMLLGFWVGAVAGFIGGKTDLLLMWFAGVVWTIPTLLLAIAINFVLGTGFWQLMLAIALSNWVDIARLVRGQVLSIRQMPFIEAAESVGLKPLPILFRHIFPNLYSPLIVMAVANFGSAILIESGLSFLGLGVGVGIPTWGRMVYDGYAFLLFERGRWLAILPGCALILLVVSINLIGNWLRDSQENA